MFDEIQPDMENFVEDCSRHCPKTMAGHFYCTKARAAQGGKNHTVGLLLLSDPAGRQMERFIASSAPFEL